MSEIVYTETTNRGQQPDFSGTYPPIRQPTENKVTIFRSPGKVAIVRSTLIVGVPNRNHMDKRFYQWRTTHSMGLRLNSSGKVVPYAARRPWDYKKGTAWTGQIPEQAVDALTSDDNSDLAQAYRQACDLEFGIKSLHDLYPIAGEYGLISYRSMPMYFRAAMRAGSMQDFATQVFGKNRVNSSLVQAAAATEPYVVALAHQFRGLVPDESLIKFMDKTHFDEEMESTYDSHTPLIRKNILAINESSRKRLLERGLDASDLNQISSAPSYKHRMYLLKDTTEYGVWSEVVVPSLRPRAVVAPRSGV